MRVLRRVETKIFFALMALVMLLSFFFAGTGFVRVSAEEGADGATPTVIETEVDGIAFVQHPTCVYFGFRLTESDYDDFGLREGGFENTPQAEAYNTYIKETLSYWSNFSSMNSARVDFSMTYAYWNGSSVGPFWFANTVAHRSTLEVLEYGFVILIPAGTTFPSLAYVKNNLEGAPVMYQTISDKAFYYDGSAFVPMSYKGAQDRIEAEKIITSVDYSLYKAEEQAMIDQLIEETWFKLNVCFTSYAVQDLLNEFDAKLSQIMTKQQYAELALYKEQKTAELAEFFNGLSQENYTEEAWKRVLALQVEGDAILQSVNSIDDVEGTVYAIKAAVGNVLTKEQQAAFEADKQAAKQRLESKFVESLYRDAEREQGKALVAEGLAAIASATSYNELDAFEATYISKIAALKTNAQWQEEEKKQETETPSESSSLEGTEEGCGSAVDGISVVLGATLLAAGMMIKKRKKGGV